MIALPVRLRAAAVATGACLGVLLLCWAAASGPAVLVRGGPRPQPGEQSPTPAPQPVTPGSAAPADQLVPDPSRLGALLVTGLVLFLVVLVVLLLLGVRAAYLGRPGRGRRTAPSPDAPAGGLDAGDEVRQALRRDAPSLLATLDLGAPGDAIVACWLRLERSVSDAGVQRSPWETSSEYAVRVLRALDLDPRAVAGLAALYREARFSDHRLGEDARAAARTHLQAVAADLEGLRA